MKIIITESRIKNFLRDKFGVDLTGQFSLIQSFEELPSYAKVINKKLFNHYLNRFGPIFLLKLDDDYAIQFQDSEYSENTMIVNLKTDSNIKEFSLLKKVGLENSGLTLKQVVDIYFEE